MGLGKALSSRGFSAIEDDDFVLLNTEFLWLRQHFHEEVTLLPENDEQNRRLDEMLARLALQDTFIVYSDLRDRGVYPRSGMQFGVDYVAYSTPTPDVSHSLFLVLVVQGTRSEPTPLGMLVRLAGSQQKDLLLARLHHSRVEYARLSRFNPDSKVLTNASSFYTRKDHSNT